MSARHSPQLHMPLPQGLPLRAKLLGFFILALALLVVLVSNRWLSDRYLETSRNRSEVRLALYSGNLVSELQRTSVVPLLLSRDPELIRSLREGDFSRTSAKLIALQNEIGVASIRLLDVSGRVVAATNRNILGTNFRGESAFVDAQRTNETIFTATPRDSGAFDFSYSRAIRVDGKILGVIVVSVDLMKYERAWAGLSDAVVVTNSEGVVILTTVPSWRARPLAEASAEGAPQSALARFGEALTGWTRITPDAWNQGVPVMKTEARIPFRGWRIVTFTDYTAVREQVNGILALEIMGFALLTSLTFYLLSRKAWSQSNFLRRESDELRALNARLQREIAERQKVEANLQVAEQTLEQSSKLAVLGEMSASVSHELNQPLAAMKTYLAGARLLLQRQRPDEALSSFQRIDDLIDRMGSITRQLKSYARKGGEAFEPVDLRQCLSSALAMMEPQLRSRVIKITRHVPRKPVMILADRIRVEQVIINLMRNAIDALREVPDPHIELILQVDKVATLLVRDNGEGISDLDNLFEPFYTTKKPGEGVGLGLAISSGIVSDLGGRLTARNVEGVSMGAKDGAEAAKGASAKQAAGRGAIFEMQLPLLAQGQAAAE